MFNPTQQQVRSFFCEAWRKFRRPQIGEQLQALEQIAVEIIALHPEYHALLESNTTQQAEYETDGQPNPFLHLSLHLGVAEQLSIDQPSGIKAEFLRLQTQHGDPHDALHDVLDCLGETMWQAQRTQQSPDGLAYLECIRKKLEKK